MNKLWEVQGETPMHHNLGRSKAKGFRRIFTLRDTSVELPSQGKLNATFNIHHVKIHEKHPEAKGNPHRIEIEIKESSQTRDNLDGIRRPRVVVTLNLSPSDGKNPSVISHTILGEHGAQVDPRQIAKLREALKIVLGNENYRRPSTPKFHLVKNVILSYLNNIK